MRSVFFLERFHPDLQGQSRACDAHRPCRARNGLQAVAASQADGIAVRNPCYTLTYGCASRPDLRSCTVRLKPL
jgi:hypothetical protein